MPKNDHEGHIDASNKVLNSDRPMRPAAMNGPLEILFSYAHEDEKLMDEVRRQLIVYERNGQILKWHDRMIPAGSG